MTNRTQVTSTSLCDIRPTGETLRLASRFGALPTELWPKCWITPGTAMPGVREGDLFSMDPSQTTQQKALLAANRNFRNKFSAPSGV